MGGMIFRIMIEIFKGKVTVKSAFFYTTDTIDAKASWALLGLLV